MSDTPKGARNNELCLVKKIRKNGQFFDPWAAFLSSGQFWDSCIKDLSISLSWERVFRHQMDIYSTHAQHFCPVDKKSTHGQHFCPFYSKKNDWFDDDLWCSSMRIRRNIPSNPMKRNESKELFFWLILDSLISFRWNYYSIGVRMLLKCNTNGIGEGSSYTSRLPVCSK